MRLLTIVSTCIFLFSGCYSFKGTDIGDTTTYAITGFNDLTSRANPEYIQLLEQEIREQINSNTRLIEVKEDEKPHLEFSGKVSRYAVEEQAANAQDETAFNRFIITLDVDLINNLNENKGWKKNFTEGEPLGESITFPFTDIEEELEQIDILNVRLVEKIFNAAFTNW